MQLRWGQYRWPVNGVGVTSARKVVRGSDGVPWKVTDTITADGYLEAVGQAALTAAQQEMERELSKHYRDLVFERDDGQASATLLNNAASIGGVFITDGPNFKDVKGPEYVTQRHFDFTAEAEYVARNAPAITEWSESVRIEGGGPLYACLPAIVGPSQRQMIYQLEPCMAVQQGSATGSYGYPPVPGPIWPFALARKPVIGRTSPQKVGRRGYTEYKVDWTYQYCWPAPLFGFPTLWPV